MSEELTQQNQEFSFGEQLVGINFNPSKIPEVNEVKIAMAKIADIVNDWPQTHPLHDLVKQHALGEILNAQMSVVKLLTLQ